MNKTTIVLGATDDSFRYSYKAVINLIRKKIPVIPIGNRPGTIFDIEIITEKKIVENVHTISIYLNQQRQKEYYNYIMTLMPKRVIFNPGTYNEELALMCVKEGISVLQECTIHMLNSDEF